MDEIELEVGDSIFDRISDAIGRSDFVVFFVSKASLDSAWARLELQSAISKQLRTQGLRVLPAILDGSPPPTLLDGILWADLNADFDAGVEALVKAVRSRFAGPETVENPNQGELEAQFDKAFSGIPKARSGVHFLILSGPSSSGKDTLLREVEWALGGRIETLRKYTTRPKRLKEEEYSRPISPEEFLHLRDKGGIIFPFRKRGTWYGFDAAHFDSAVRAGMHVICVLTELGLVPLIKEALRSKGITTTAFFIEAPDDVLERRTLRRDFSSEEAVGRMRSINQDRIEIRLRSSFRQEYTFVKNLERGSGLGDASDTLIAAIRKLLDEHSTPKSRRTLSLREWQTFGPDLVAGLHSKDEGARYLILEVAPFYVQALAAAEPGDFLVEAVSNVFLPKEDQLRKESESILADLGFQRSSEVGNFSMRLRGVHPETVSTILHRALTLAYPVRIDDWAQVTISG